MSPNTTDPTSVDFFVTNPTFSIPNASDAAAAVLGATKTRFGSVAEGANVSEKMFLELSNDVTIVKFWIGFRDPIEAENFRFRQDLASK